MIQPILILPITAGYNEAVCIIVEFGNIKL